MIHGVKTRNTTFQVKLRRALVFFTPGKKEKRPAGGDPFARTNLQVVRRVMEHGDLPVTLQLTGEQVRVKAICVSLERCTIDKTALWQFVNCGCFLRACQRGLSAFICACG